MKSLVQAHWCSIGLPAEFQTKMAKSGNRLSNGTITIFATIQALTFSHYWVDLIETLCRRHELLVFFYINACFNVETKQFPEVSQILLCSILGWNLRLNEGSIWNGHEQIFAGEIIRSIEQSWTMIVGCVWSDSQLNPMHNRVVLVTLTTITILVGLSFHQIQPNQTTVADVPSCGLTDDFIDFLENNGKCWLTK